MKRRRLPKGCSEFQDRHGKWRVRYRRKGFPTYYFKAVAWSPAFMEEYRLCLAGTAVAAKPIGAKRTRPGSVSALVVAYYGSPEYLSLAASTRATYRNIIERFRAEHGDKRVAAIERQHVKALVGARSETPAAANNLLRMIRMLMAFAIDIGLRADDPTHRLRGFRRSGGGYHTWTESEIETFENVHAVGTKARLALGLLLYTGQRRSDVVTMGWQHVDAGRIRVRQQKTGTRLLIPMHGELLALLAETPRDNLTFLTTTAGAAYTPAGFGNWFREQCDAAGLPGCSAHGLRKAASRRLAEAGCSNQLIKSITGHRTDKEVSRYTEEADQALLADQAIAALSGAKRERKLANPMANQPRSERKSLRGKDTR